MVNKHWPLTVYPGWHPAHWMEIITPRGSRTVSNNVGKLVYRAGMSKFDNCDLIVQCGGPVIEENCHRATWAVPIWHQVIGRLYQRIPVFNLAAGSWYPWEHQPVRIENNQDQAYIKKILDYCRLTTVRDSLARDLCHTLGYDVPLVLDTGFLAGKHYESNLSDDDLILINYMPNGGHRTWGDKEVKVKWRQTILEVIKYLKRHHRLAFMCHNESEYNVASNIDPDIPRFWPDTPSAYFKIATGAKAAICNRMHAAVGMAGMGIPAMAICTDTRLKMVEALGVPCFYAKEVTSEQLIVTIEDLLNNRHKEKERLKKLQSDTWNQYIELLSTHWKA